MGGGVYNISKKKSVGIIIGILGIFLKKFSMTI